MRMALASQPNAIAELRPVIERAAGHGSAERKILPFEVAELDQHLPGGGLALGHLHEVMKAGPASEYAGLATLFTAGIVARLAGPVLWCLRTRALFVPTNRMAVVVVFAVPPLALAIVTICMASHQLSDIQRT